MSPSNCHVCTSFPSFLLIFVAAEKQVKEEEVSLRLNYLYKFTAFFSQLQLKFFSQDKNIITIEFC